MSLALRRASASSHASGLAPPSRKKGWRPALSPLSHLYGCGLGLRKPRRGGQGRGGIAWRSEADTPRSKRIERGRSERGAATEPQVRCERCVALSVNGDPHLAVTPAAWHCAIEAGAHASATALDSRASLGDSVNHGSQPGLESAGLARGRRLRCDLFGRTAAGRKPAPAALAESTRNLARHAAAGRPAAECPPPRRGVFRSESPACLPRGASESGSASARRATACGAPEGCGMAAQAIIDDASRGCASEAGLGRLVVTLRPVLSLPEGASLDDTK